MELYILNSRYEIVGMIDAAESILWNKKYNDIGYCEIYVPCDEEMLALLQRGHYVYRYDDDMFCKIETVEITTDAEEGDYIIATANDMGNILAGRIVRWQIVYSGTVAGFIKQVLVENLINPVQSQRRITNFEVDDSNFSEFRDRIDVTTSAEDILQLIMATCKAYNYGFRVSYNINTQKLVFRLYRGADKATAQSDEYIEFSPTFANILSSNYKEDESNFKNIAYVGYMNSNEEFALLSMYNGTSETDGEDRREVYVDGTQQSREVTLDELKGLFPSAYRAGNTYYIDDAGETIAVATVEVMENAETGESEEKITVTDYSYMLMIQRLGRFALAEHTKKQSISGSVDTIDTYEYKEDYDLGDVVKVVNEYGISAEAQIVEIMESDDNENGYVIEPIFEYDY